MIGLADRLASGLLNHKLFSNLLELYFPLIWLLEIDCGQMAVKKIHKV